MDILRRCCAKEFLADTKATLFGSAVVKLEEETAAVEIHKAKGRLLKRIVDYDVLVILGVFVRTQRDLVDHH